MIQNPFNEFSPAIQALLYFTLLVLAGILTSIVAFIAGVIRTSLNDLKNPRKRR